MQRVSSDVVKQLEASEIMSVISMHSFRKSII